MPQTKSKVKSQKSKVIKTVKQSTKVAKSNQLTETKKTKSKTENKQTGLTVKIFDTTGKASGTISLPKEVFGQKPNLGLLRQAYHVYFTNRSGHFADTKTRAEISGGGRKPWRQKGTGRARAGSTRSPLWVGGAKALGPKTRVTQLDLPKKMKRKALISALSQKAQDGKIKVIANFEKINPKTKTVANLLTKTETAKPTLLVISQKSENLKLASRNIQNITLDIASNLNAYQVIKNKELLISQEALAKLS